MGLRLSDRYYTGSYENYRDINQAAYHQFIDDKYKLGINIFFIEPGITASFGAGNLKFNIMAGFSFNTSGFELNSAIIENEGFVYPFFYFNRIYLYN